MHRTFSQEYDTFVCYQKLENNIASIQQHGIDPFEASQRIRETLLRDMLSNFNEGRSKTYYCISATVFEIKDLKAALVQAKKDSAGLTIKESSKILHTIMDKIAEDKGYCLRLRKPVKKAG